MIEEKIPFDNKSKLDPEIEKMMKDMLNESYWRGVKYGGKFVVKTLREAMQVSGLDKVEPMWLDTAERELNQLNIIGTKTSD